MLYLALIQQRQNTEGELEVEMKLKLFSELKQ